MNDDPQCLLKDVKTGSYLKGFSKGHIGEPIWCEKKAATQYTAMEALHLQRRLETQYPENRIIFIEDVP